MFYQPAQRHFDQTRCQPIVSSWLTMGSPLNQVAQACGGRGLKLRAILSAAATGRMAERYPEFACRNAFGDESLQRLCLANPEVQTYLRAMAVDLSTSDGISALTLADFDIRWSDIDDIQTAVPLGRFERSLLSMCFCGSCRQRSKSAGIDVDTARRTVEQAVQAAFEHGPREENQVENSMAEHKPLVEHRRRQIQDLNALLRQIQEACRCELLLEPCVEYACDPAVSGLDLSIPSALITCVDDPTRLPTEPPKRAKRNELRLNAASALGWAGAQLVRTLSETVQAGFAAVEIDHFGLLSESALTTLRQAIRFARRSVVG